MPRYSAVQSNPSLMPLSFHQARADDFPALEQLLELYQYDLSDIWRQRLDDRGRYGFDLTRHRRGEGSRAYLARDSEQYIGFALVAPASVTRTEGKWMEQFFIHKAHRRSGAGRALAKHVLHSNPGPWEVGQIPGNNAAYAFWHNVIGEVANGQFTELQVTEGWWRGVVQQFHVPSAA
jgi:predicted acetyltransferase